MAKEHKCYLDYFMNKQIICPYCDHLHEASEIMSNGGEDSFELDCHDCDKTFNVHQQVTYEFTTVGTCKVHKLWRWGGEENGQFSYTCQICADEYYDHNFERLGKENYEILPAEWKPGS